MSGMERISEAILNKVRADAQNVVREAEGRAKERIERAEQQRKVKFEEDKNKLLEEAREEATRILAQASISARQELLLAKTNIIDEIIVRVREILPKVSGNSPLSLNLIKEAMDTAQIDKAIIYVAPRDIDSVKKLIKADKQLASRIVEIKDCDCTGGVIVEDVEGAIRVDNTYDTRLEMLLPKLLHEIGKELFRSE